MKKIIFITMLILLSSIVWGAEGDLLFQDGFESGDYSAWTGTSGSPTISTSGCYNGSNCAQIDNLNEIFYYEHGSTLTNGMTMECWFNSTADLGDSIYYYIKSATGSAYANQVGLGTISYPTSNGGFGYYGAGGWRTLVDHNRDGHWERIRMATNNSHLFLWLNETINSTTWKTPLNPGGGRTLVFNARAGPAVPLLIDDCKLWEGVKLPVFAPPPPPTPNSSQIDLLFTNTTSTFKTVFGEGENYRAYINWTDTITGEYLNDSVGNCNISHVNGLFENISSTLNFTLCNGGCNFTTFTEPFTFDGANDTTNVTGDLIRLSACHEQTQSQPLEISIQCGVTTENLTIPASEFGLCSSGFFILSRNYSACNSFDSYNITLGSSVPFAGRHRIEDYRLDREYPIHTNFGDEIIYNATLNLWATEHFHEYYEHGTKTIFANCSHNTIIGFNNNVSESITIVNVPPVILISQILDANGTFTDINQTGTTIVQFINGTYRFLIAISDDDLANYTVTIFNSTAQIFTLTNDTLVDINVSSDNFVDFLIGNTYNISLLAVDIVGNTSFVSRLINFTDTLPPQVTGTGNETIAFNSSFQFNIVATDEYLWFFNISCTNGHSFNISGIANQSYTYDAVLPANEGTFTCDIEVADGHTTNIIRDISLGRTPEEYIIFDGLTLSTVEELKSSTVTKKTDRYNFCFETLSKQSELTVNIPEGCVIAPNSPYKGHYVCMGKKLALDFESNYMVKSQSEDSITLDISKSASNEVCFNSIVELNSVNFQKTVFVTPPPLGTFFNYQLDVTSTGSVLLMFMFLIFYIGLWVLAYTFRTFSFGVFGFLMGVLIGLMLLSFSPYFTILFTFVNVAIMFEFSSRK